MEFQTAFNVTMAVCGGASGWVIRMLYDAISNLKKENGVLHARITDLIKELPNTYARRDDVRDDYREIKTTLERIEVKLDNKADK